MLERLATLAARLQPYRWFPWCLGVAATGGLAVGIFGLTGTGGQTLSLLAINLLLWSLAAVAFLQAFAHPVAPPDPAAPLWRRISTSLKRLYRWLLAIVLGGLLVAIAWLSVRSLLLVLAE